MADQSLGEILKRPESYASRAVGGLRLWYEAQKASRYGDSIFIWIPKNAGTSVYEMLRSSGLVKLKTPRSVRLCFRNSGRVTFGHMEIGSLVDLGMVSQAFVDRAFKFALVRDPYDRAVSLYRYLCSVDVLRNWHQQPTFNDFLNLLSDGHYDRVGVYNTRGLSQCNQQIEWLRRSWPDKIYKVENIGEFASDISERWNIAPPNVRHLNQSGGASQVELSQKEKGLIERIYAEDFEAFGYARR